MFPLIYPALISIADYFTEGMFVKKSFLKTAFISFSAGVSVVYLLMQLLPEVYFGAVELNRNIALFVLLGFILHHLIEKYIYQHAPRRELVRDIRREHVLAMFVYHSIVGVVLVDLFERNAAEGILFFVPMSFHIVIDNLPKHIIHGSFFVRAFFSGATLIGGLLAFYTKFSRFVDFALLGFMGGVILYFVVRETIPKGGEGKPLFFVLGILVYMIVVTMANSYL